MAMLLLPPTKFRQCGFSEEGKHEEYTLSGSTLVQYSEGRTLAAHSVQ